jgi:hypothetical protein
MNLASKDDIRDSDAAQTMRTFYGNLESVLKRHQPIAYAPYAAQRLAAAFERPTMLAQIRPHHLLHSIEANCAYTRKQNRDSVDSNRIARIMNVYYQHRDPLHSGLCADDKLDLLFLVMYREQIELQYSYSQDELARNQELFVSNNPMPKLSGEFLGEYGLSFDAWIRLCFFANVAATTNESRLFHRRALTECNFHSIPTDHVESFLQHASLTTRQIGDRFRGVRDSTKSQFHSLIRSAFLQYPLIRLEQDVYLAPHPPLVLRHSGQGLYNATKQLPSFGDEFGASVERYVSKLLDCASRKLRAVGNTELEKLSPGKSCDFLVEFVDSIVLVESKATSFVAERLVENAILNDGSTAKIATGIEQLYTTAFDLHSGAFDCMGVDRTKPVVGIVATFGEIPFANSGWYRDSFILKRAESKLRTPAYPSVNMQRWPLVVSLGTLELLLMNLNSFDFCVTALCDEKDSEPYIKTGDWDRFLASKLAGNDLRVEQLPFVADQCDGFWRSLGIMEPPGNRGPM